MPNAQLNAPDEWRRTRSIADFQAGASSQDFSDYVVLSAIESVGAPLPLEEQMKASLSTTSVKPKPRPMDPVEIDGVEWYHLSSNGADTHTEIYGVEHNGYQTGITIYFKGDETSGDREDAVASILASFTWR